MAAADAKLWRIGIALIFYGLLLGMFPAPGGAAQESGYWSFVGTEVERPSAENLGKYCTYSGDGGRNGNLGGAQFQTRCYSTVSKTNTIYSGSMSWSYHTQFEKAVGEFNQGLDILIPGKLIGFALETASTSSANETSGWVTISSTHPGAGAPLIASTPVSPTNGKASGKGYGKITGKPTRMLSDGSVPQLLLNFELAAGNAQRGIKTRYFYKWTEAAVPPTKPPEPPLMGYVGCYKDATERDLSGDFFTHPGLTIQICMDACRQKGYGYAATQYGTQCFCGDGFGKYGKSTDCNMPCGGNRSETCGGSWANSVYALGKSPPKPPPSGNKPLGCYKDDRWDRDLSGHTFSHRDMTSTMCIDACREKGLSYAATQYSTYCFCADNYGKHGKAANCDMPCGGNKAELCGGSSANSVYATGATLPSDPPAKSKSLTGAWVHSAAGSTQTPNSKVIVVQDGNQVTLLNSYKMEVNRNQWQTARCIGPLTAGQIRFQCSWAPGGDPMGYGAPWQATFNVSEDGDHLNGVGKDAQYFSRVP